MNSYNEYNYNPYSSANRTDRYIPIDELPYLKQLARTIQINMATNPYQNNNQALQYIRELGKIMEAQKRNFPEKYNLNLQSQKVKTGDVQFNMPTLRSLFKQGYQPGVDLIPYRDMNSIGASL